MNYTSTGRRLEDWNTKCTWPDIGFEAGCLWQYMKSIPRYFGPLLNRLSSTLRDPISWELFHQFNCSWYMFSAAEWFGLGRSQRVQEASYWICLYICRGTPFAEVPTSLLSKMQSVATTSTPKAEYLATDSSAQKCIWRGRLFAFAKKSRRPQATC